MPTKLPNQARPISCPWFTYLCLYICIRKLVHFTLSHSALKGQVVCVSEIPDLPLCTKIPYSIQHRYFHPRKITRRFSALDQLHKPSPLLPLNLIIPSSQFSSNPPLPQPARTHVRTISSSLMWLPFFNLQPCFKSLHGSSMPVAGISSSGTMLRDPRSLHHPPHLFSKAMAITPIFSLNLHSTLLVPQNIFICLITFLATCPGITSYNPSLN